MQEFRIKKVTIISGETYYQPQIKQGEEWFFYSYVDNGKCTLSLINGRFFWDYKGCIKFIKEMSDATAYWKQKNVEYIPFTKEIAESCQ
jgi:hypothetical protein